MTIAVTGVTGHLGRLVVQKLVATGDAANVVGLARTPSKAADIGVSVREADYDRPETLEAALKSIDTLLLVSSSEFGKRIEHHTNTINAAKGAGVKWIVYTSILRADTSTISLAAEHRGTEEVLKASGIPFTLLRNGWYTENKTDAIGGALAGGAYIGSAKDGRISSAARADFADAAVAVLTGAGHAGHTYELAGDDSYTLSELAAEISRQTGKNLPYVDMPAAEYASALESHGLPGWLATTIADWDVATAGGALYSTDRALSRLIGRPTTPLSVSVKQALEAMQTTAV